MIKHTNGYCDTCGEMYVKGYETNHPKCSVYGAYDLEPLIEKIRILHDYLLKPFSRESMEIETPKELKSFNGCFLRINASSLYYYRESPHNGDLYDEQEERISSGYMHQILTNYYKSVREEAFRKAKHEVIAELVNKKLDALFPPVSYL